MPGNIGRIHDWVLMNYFKKKNQDVLCDRFFETFLITKQSNLVEFFVGRVLEFNDSNYLYLGGLIILKPTDTARVLSDCFGNILSTNKKSNALFNLDSLNKDACVFNYIPQLLWHFFRYDEEKMEEEKPGLDDLKIRKDN